MITYPFSNFYSAAIAVWGLISNFISNFTGMWLFIHAGIEVKSMLVKGAPGTYEKDLNQNIDIEKFDMLISDMLLCYVINYLNKKNCVSFDKKSSNILNNTR